MIKVYGCSDDLVEIEGSTYEEDEIGCYDRDVLIDFVDGTKISCPLREAGIGDMGNYHGAAWYGSSNPDRVRGRGSRHLQRYI